MTLETRVDALEAVGDCPVVEVVDVRELAPEAERWAIAEAERKAGPRGVVIVIRYDPCRCGSCHSPADTV